MIGRWPKRALLFASAAVIAVLLTAVIDHQIAAGLERSQFRDWFFIRAWIYSLAMMGTVTALVVAGLRSAPRSRWHELFTDLGIAAVCALGLALVITSSVGDLLDNKAPLLLPPVLMILGAGVGSLRTRKEDNALAAPASGASGQPQREPRGRSVDRLYSRIGSITFGFSVLTVLLLVVLGVAVHDTGCSDRNGGGLIVVLLGALGSGLAVGVCGVLALVARRWVLSLLSISFAAIALFVAAGLAFGNCLD